MNLKGTLFIFLCAFSLQLNAQFKLHLGYNLSNHYKWNKGASFVEYDFNDSNVSDLKDPHQFGNLFKGYVIGFGGTIKNFGMDMLFHRRSITSEASKIDDNGQDVYSKIRYFNNAFSINVFFGSEKIKFGYGFEFGRFKRRDLSDPEGDWSKSVRNKPLTVGMKLLSRIYLTEEDAPVGFILMPYWRFNGGTREHYTNTFTRREFFKLNTIGLSAIISIDLGE